MSSVLPYLPAGSSLGPAERFIIFADSFDRWTLFIDESSKTLEDGSSFIAFWESGTLNQGDPRSATTHTLKLFGVRYAAEVATSLTIKASGDGGQTWSETKVLEVEQTVGSQTKRAYVPFNTAGQDLRIRIEFDTDVLVNVSKLFWKVEDGGDLIR